MRMLTLLAVLMLAGCGFMGEDGKDVSGIKSGLYEYRENFSYDGTFVSMVNQMHFNGDATYSASVFVGDVEVIQASGKWKQNNDSVITSARLKRALNSTGGWGPWEQVSGNGGIWIRNVNATSFQQWEDFHNLTAEQKAHFQGLTPGWRTYNRIAD